MRNLILLVAAITTACAADYDWDGTGQTSQETISNSEEPASSDSGGTFANYCVTSPVDDVNNMLLDPNYVMAYRSGQHSSATSCASSSPISPWYSVNDGGYHRQSIQRMYVGTTNYLLVSMSIDFPDPPDPTNGTSTPGPSPLKAGFEVVRLGAYDAGSDSQLGSGGATTTTLAPCDNRVIAYAGITTRPHAGGMSTFGNYVVVPFEDIDHSRSALFRVYDMSDPAAPTFVVGRNRVNGQLGDASAATMVRLSDDKFMLMVFGRDATDVEVFVSNGTTFPALASEWKPKGAWALPFVIPPVLGGPAYQNIQLITQCDPVDDDAPLYAVATFKQDDGDDWVDLYKVDVDPTTFEPTFDFVADANVICNSSNTGNERYCDFKAGAGAYADVDNELIVYGVEHWNDQPANDDHDDGVKVREFP